MNKHKKQNLGKTLILSALAALVFTGCKTNVDIESTTTTEHIAFTPQSFTASGCPGSYNGFAKMTNIIDGTFWISGTNSGGSTGVFTDASGFPSPYVSVVQVTRKSDNKKWCDTNSVSFPVTNTANYSFTVYVKSPLPPPTNGESMTLQLTW